MLWNRIKIFFENKFQYHKIDLIDKESKYIRKFFDESNNNINDSIINGGNILVH